MKLEEGEATSIQTPITTTTTLPGRIALKEASRNVSLLIPTTQTAAVQARLEHQASQDDVLRLEGPEEGQDEPLRHSAVGRHATSA